MSRVLRGLFNMDKRIEGTEGLADLTIGLWMALATDMVFAFVPEQAASWSPILAVKLAFGVLLATLGIFYMTRFVLYGGFPFKILEVTDGE